MLLTTHGFICCDVDTTSDTSRGHIDTCPEMKLRNVINFTTSGETADVERPTSSDLM